MGPIVLDCLKGSFLKKKPFQDKNAVNHGSSQLKKKSFQHKDRCKSIKFTITPSSAELEGVLFSSHSSCVHFTLLPCWAAGPNSVARFSCSMGWSLASCNAELCWRLSPPCSIQLWLAEPFQRQYSICIQERSNHASHSELSDFARPLVLCSNFQPLL